MNFSTALGERVLADSYPEIFDKQISEQVYKNFVGQVLPSDKLFIVLGSDGGRLVEYLKSLASPSQVFIFLETEELTSALSQEFANSSNFKVSFMPFSQFSFSDLLNDYEDYVFRDAIVLFKSVQVEADVGTYKGLSSHFKEKLNRFLINEVANFDFENHFNQQIKNACDLVHPLSKISGQLNSEIPGIILGGGPSLDKVIPWLRENQSRVWIFAASRISKRLHQEGITPDFIGVFDSKPLMFDYSKEMFHFQSTSILVTGEHPFEGIVRQWPGLKAYSRRRFPWAKNSENNFISDGPTVTNALFGIAAYLGVKKLYLAGVDYCFTAEGQCHEKSSVENQSNLHDKADTYVLNYKGETVGVNIQLFHARTLLESHYKTLLQEWPDFQAFNTNDGAAVIEGINVCPIEQINCSVEKFSVIQQFSDVLGESSQQTQKFLNDLQSDLTLYKQWFSGLIAQALAGEELVNKIFSSPAKQKKRIERVLKIKMDIEKSMSVDFQTIVNYGHRFFKSALKPSASEDKMSHHEIIDSLSNFFKAVRLSATSFRDQLCLLDKELQFRFKEVNDRTDFEVLANQWIVSKIPGRFKVWLTNFSKHKESFYQEKYPELTGLLNRNFEFMLVDESGLEMDIKSRDKSPDEFLKWLEEIIETRDMAQLKVAKGSIARHEKDKCYQFVSSFANGITLEFKGELEDALVHYMNLDPSHQNLWVQKQLYPLAFKSQKFEIGVKALEFLSLMSPDYLPLLADAYHLTESYEMEITALASYLKYVPDTALLIRLLQVLIQENRVGDANSILQQVESNDAYDQKVLQDFVDNLNH